MSESKSPVLEPHTQVFFDALISQGGEPLYKLSYPAARKVLEDLQAAPVTKLPADVEDEVPVRIYRPQGGRRSLPAVIGLGDHFDTDKLVAYPPGTVIVLPGKTSHFHWAKSGEFFTQVSTFGPLGMEYVNSKDDPRN